MATHSSVLGESQGQRSLVGCRLWVHTESGTTKVTQQQQLVHSLNLYLLCIVYKTQKQIN